MIDLPYHSLVQLREELGVNLHQLHEIIKEKKTRCLAYIGHEHIKRGFFAPDSASYIIIESKKNKNDFKSAAFQPEDKQITHDGYVELNDGDLRHLFDNEKKWEEKRLDKRRSTNISELFCPKEGYVRHLNIPCSIYFTDVYIHINDYEKIIPLSKNNDKILNGRIEYNKIPNDFCKLTIDFSKEEIQKILEEAEKGNFLVFVKVSQSNNAEIFVSLMPLEVTTIRNNNPSKTNIILGNKKECHTNISELWISKNTTTVFFNKINSSTYPKSENKNTSKIASNLDLATIGREGGKKSKLKKELLGLATHELSQNRGCTAFIKMLEDDYTSYDPYNGTNDCYDIYIDGKIVYTTSDDNNNTICKSISTRSLERYFTAVSSQNKK